MRKKVGKGKGPHGRPALQAVNSSASLDLWTSWSGPSPTKSPWIKATAFDSDLVDDDQLCRDSDSEARDPIVRAHPLYTKVLPAAFHLYSFGQRTCIVATLVGRAGRLPPKEPGQGLARSRAVTCRSADRFRFLLDDGAKE